MIIRKFEEIEGWKMGRELAQLVYEISRNGEFPRDYGLKDQIRRAAGSVMHNIAEGFDGGSDAEFTKFLRYSQRSCSEIQSQLYIALDQGYINQESFRKIYELADQTRSKIGGLILYLTKTSSSSRPRTRD